LRESHTLLVEGWRFIPHSYAVVNQFQLLSLLNEPGLRILHRDMPYFREQWRPVNGLFSSEAEAALRAIPAVTGEAQADAVLRITYPYNLAPSPHRRTCVFGTSEWGCVPDHYLAQNRSLRKVMSESDCLILTCSKWSRDGFVQSGADPNRVVVIPHGVDPLIYHPLAEAERTALRGQLGWTGFVFLTVGALTPNKGLALLLKAFAAVSQHYPHVRLVIKGLDSLYPSRALLLRQAKGLTQAEGQRVQDRLLYLGQTLSFTEMAQLYQGADAYVSPYLAEAFNMPVLEAAASGALVICTAGGATDDFTTPDFTLPIHSTVQPVEQARGVWGHQLQPDYDSLLQQMTAAVEQPQLASRARLAGPAVVATGFSWDLVARRLVDILFNPHY
jgi:glycosyltransferase involved in cell wall biosynthesis